MGAEAGHNCVGWAARDDKGHLSPYQFTRRDPRPTDVTIRITHCGICHSDLHQIRNEWAGSNYPMVPGHEIVGIVEKVGAEVKNFKAGDRAGVGCMVNSCRNCDACQKGLEQFCHKGATFTYNGTDTDGTPTQGGYSQFVVVDKDFVLRVPENLPMDGAAPLLCAGITTYSPLVHFQMNEAGKTLGVVGLGGLGHMAVQFGKAFGMKVVVLSTSPHKKEEALKGLGADEFIVSKDEEQMKKAAKTVDFIIDTVSAKHPLEPYFALLKTDGKYVVVGVPTEPHSIGAATLVFGRHMLAGSLIGGIKETQEMLDFCGKHNITCKIENIDVAYLNTAMERLEKSDVKYRFVIEIEKTLKGDNAKVE